MKGTKHRPQLKSSQGSPRHQGNHRLASTNHSSGRCVNQDNIGSGDNVMGLLIKKNRCGKGRREGKDNGYDQGDCFKRRCKGTYEEDADQDCDYGYYISQKQPLNHTQP
jgi:hypothetical protein